jgi:hypothetical protein
LPAAHFAAAWAWLFVAALWWPPAASRLVAGDLYGPDVLAITHVLALGVLGSAIIGAELQFVPGALGVPLRSVRVAWGSLVAYEVGAGALVVGLRTGRVSLLIIGWIGLVLALGAAAWNILRVARRSVHGRQIGRFLVAAYVAMAGVVLLAGWRIGARAGWWPAAHLPLVAAHAMLGLAGFGTFTAFGVGSRMIPAFLGATGDDARALRGLVWSLGIGLAAFAGGAAWRLTTLRLVGTGLLLLAGGVGVGLLVHWLRRRWRPLDATGWHIATAASALALALGVGVAFVGRALMGPAIPDGAPDTTRLFAILVVVLLLGWLLTLTLGVQVKILSHLAHPWLVRGRPVSAPTLTPRDLAPPRPLLVSVIAMTLGWGALALAVALDARAWLLLAMVAWPFGAVLHLSVPVRALLRRRTGA